MTAADLTGLFDGRYRGRRVLVTGHTGFKGSWLTYWLARMGADVHAFALAPETTPSHAALIGTPVQSRIADVRDRAAVRDTVAAARPEIIFHLAAQALVKRGYADPQQTFETNVMGTLHLLDAVRDVGGVRAVVVVTSDKCYRNDDNMPPFTERDALGGHDPYSASKACTELVAASYRASFFGADSLSRTFLATARAGNVIGGGDWAANRLVPDLMRAAAAAESVPIRAPGAVRPWQHVLEPLAAYLLLGEALLSGGVRARTAASDWNFGPADEGHRPVSDVVSACARHWPAVRAEADHADHEHEAAVLRLDCTKARTLGWRPVWDFTRMMERTAAWYRAQHEQGICRTGDDLQQFIADARASGLSWAAGEASALRRAG